MGVGIVGRFSEIKYEVYMSFSNGWIKIFLYVYLIIVLEIL